jgi:hypothetical protein
VRGRAGYEGGPGGCTPGGLRLYFELKPVQYLCRAREGRRGRKYVWAYFRTCALDVRKLFVLKWLFPIEHCITDSFNFTNTGDSVYSHRF